MFYFTCYIFLSKRRNRFLIGKYCLSFYTLQSIVFHQKWILRKLVGGAETFPSDRFPWFVISNLWIAEKKPLKCLLLSILLISDQYFLQFLFAIKNIDFDGGSWNRVHLCCELQGTLVRSVRSIDFWDLTLKRVTMYKL